MTHDGQAFALQTSGHHTDAGASGSLLSTPDTVPDAPNTGANRGRKAGHPIGLGNQVQALLPTPVTIDRVSEGSHQGAQYLSSRLMTDMLLPTPAANLSESGPDYARAGRPESGGDDLTTSLARLLPTPTSQAARHGTTPDLTAESPAANLWNLPSLLDGSLPALLPTPKAGDGGRYPDKENQNLPVTITDLLLPTPNPFHLENTETVEDWIERRAEVEDRTGTRHGPALPVVVISAAQGHPLYQAGDGPMLWNGGPTETPSSGGNDSPGQPQPPQSQARKALSDCLRGSLSG
jgi:hypothetical protein